MVVVPRPPCPVCSLLSVLVTGLAAGRGKHTCQLPRGERVTYHLLCIAYCPVPTSPKAIEECRSTGRQSAVLETTRGKVLLPIHVLVLGCDDNFPRGNGEQVAHNTRAEFELLKVTPGEMILCS